jgi:SWI/SNF-related matrix-associated actin-dependent regulator of chromatin subfamily B protein 1
MSPESLSTAGQASGQNPADSASSNPEISALKSSINKSSQSPTSPHGRQSSSSRVSPSSSSNKPTVISEESKAATQQALLNEYIRKDLLNSASIVAENDRQREFFFAKRREAEFLQQVRKERPQNAAAIFGPGYMGYGNGFTDSDKVIVYPANRKRPGKRITPRIRVTRSQMETQADQKEELVPIRLDIELENVKLRDTFTWNLHDRIVPPELFAQQLVEDFQLPPQDAQHLMQMIHHSLLDQIQDFYPHIFIREDALDPHLPYFAYKNDEMRVIIKLNITIGQHTLIDQFEWDMNNELNSPEEFAVQMTKDLALSGEFTTAIAHAIREQIQQYTKSLYIVGHPFDGRPIDDGDLLEALQPSPLPTVFRPAFQAKDFTPYLYELNEGELEKAEKSQMKELRRNRRTVNRRGGPALPDLKERLRTIRSLVVSTVLPGAAQSLDQARLFKRTEVATKPGRRAARGDAMDVDESSSGEESDDSPPASPDLSAVNTGTSRTRVKRGAASAATAAMRASTNLSLNLGRSATPEIFLEEKPKAGRRAHRSEREEESEVPSTLVVKLKIGKDRLRAFLRGESVGRNIDRKTPVKPPSLPPPTPTVSTVPVPPPSLVTVPESTESQQQQQPTSTKKKETPIPLPPLPAPTSTTPSSTTPQPSAVTPTPSSSSAPHPLSERIEAPGPPGPGVLAVSNLPSPPAFPQ